MSLPLPELDYWQLLAGLGLFLLGMDQLERAVHAVAGRQFSAMLRHATGHPLLSIALGFFATAVLQSSSILGLMVLAFVGAGILPMRNAIGVILGSNIGSTVTGWLVAAVGFSLDLEAMALPVIGLGAVGVVFAAAETRVNAWSAILLAFGLMLLGMQQMVGAADTFARGFDPATLAGQHPIVFFLAGVIITVIVRTSAATIMMTLSAMNAGIIGLEQAAAIAIGADLGTTSTMAIAAVKGVAAKKQVALCHVLFNTATDLLAFFLLLPHVTAITAFYGVGDPLFALVAFHTTFNLIGVALFYPFIPRLGDFLERRFAAGNDEVAQFLTKVPAAEKETAFAALEKEVRGLYRRVMALNLRALKIDLPDAMAAEQAAPAGPIGNLLGEHPTFSADYEAIKRLEGELLAYVRQLQAQRLDERESGRLAVLLIAAREAVQAAKAVKDVRENLVDFRHSGNAWLQGHVDEYNAALRDFYATLADMLFRPHHELMVADILDRLNVQEAKLHDLMKQRTYTEDVRSGLSDLELSTVLNVLHEVHAANRALLRGGRGMLLDEIAV